ncbi:unnamed protein product [Vitrella brassicaformis CCMP3155]|uniref:NFACT RNA-binding domain-containing protein n=1 Tax=Vitrella brassicaformis (strain CCMP3155) TaxID=1169540 RepID=A0A0G4ENT6_VITBC|nr:unnamed protein product [Vitrella brassicaformis CCMP3155]|eukprot:CEL99012.1 unnamed protein product [Vitrella brassicaformis CCMP3155]
MNRCVLALVYPLVLLLFLFFRRHHASSRGASFIKTAPCIARERAPRLEEAPRAALQAPDTDVSSVSSALKALYQPKAKKQTVDFTTLLLSCRELNASLVPSSVSSAFQLDDSNLLLGLTTLSGTRWLHLCWDAKAARLALGENPPKKEILPFSFSHNIRLALKGLTLTAISLPQPFNRIVEMTFAPRLGRDPFFKLFVEVQGPRSNVILVSADTNSIAACAYQVGASRSVRPLQTGQLYQLPPAQSGRLPSLEETWDVFHRRLSVVPEMSLQKAFIDSYRGLSPALIIEMALVAGLDAQTPIKDIPEASLRSLYEGPWKRWLQLVLSDTENPASVQPALRIGGEGQRLSYAVLGLLPAIDADAADTSEPSWVKAKSMQELLRIYYGEHGSKRWDDLKTRCDRAVKSRLQKSEQRVQLFEKQLASADESEVERLRKRGDLLMAYQHEWAAGDSELICEDFETHESVSIPIPPDKTPLELAQAAYKRSGKLQRSIAAVMPQLDKARDDLQYLQSIETAIEDLAQYRRDSDIKLLQEIAEELGIYGSETNEARKKPAKGKQAKGARRGKGKAAAAGKVHKASMKGLLVIDCPREGTNDTPAVVIAGRNNRQNDRLTFDIARNSEMWLHAQGLPGSHCILRGPSSEADVQFAAHVAAYLSKGKNSVQVPVVYTLIRDVKRAPGGQLGLVTVRNEKVVWGRPEEGRQVVERAMREGADH